MIELFIDAGVGYLYKDGEMFSTLKSAEANILERLVNKQPDVVSKVDLLCIGWPEGVVGPNSLNMTIKN